MNFQENERSLENQTVSNVFMLFLDQFKMTGPIEVSEFFKPRKSLLEISQIELSNNLSKLSERMKKLGAIK